MNLYNVWFSLSEMSDKKYWTFSWYSDCFRCTWYNFINICLQPFNWTWTHNVYRWNFSIFFFELCVCWLVSVYWMLYATINCLLSWSRRRYSRNTTRGSKSQINQKAQSCTGAHTADWMIQALCQLLAFLRSIPLEALEKRLRVWDTYG